MDPKLSPESKYTGTLGVVVVVPLGSATITSTLDTVGDPPKCNVITKIALWQLNWAVVNTTAGLAHSVDAAQRGACRIAPGAHGAAPGPSASSGKMRSS